MDQSRQDQARESFDAQLAISNQIARIAKPLYKHFGIHIYHQYTVYESGETLHLTNHPELNERLIGKTFDQTQYSYATRFLNVYPHLGCYLMDNEPAIQAKLSAKILQLSEEYDAQYIFAILSQLKTPRGNAITKSIFCAPSEHLEANRFYINNIDLLGRFNHHVRETLDKTLQSLPLAPPTASEKHVVQQQFQRLGISPYPIKAFVKETGMHHPKYTQLSEQHLSAREHDLIYWYLRGKTEVDTATILNLSINTIHKYFQRLMEKFKCYNKIQLILKLIDAGLIEENDWRTIY